MSSTHGHRRWDFVFIFLMSATRASSDSNRSRQWRARSALIARTGDRNRWRWNDCTWVSVRTCGTASDLLVLREELIELALVRVVVEEVVELGARLHRRDEALLGAVSPERLVDGEGRRVHGTERRERIEHDLDAGAGQLVDGEHRRQGELGDVGEGRDAARVGGKPVCRVMCGRLWAEHMEARW